MSRSIVEYQFQNTIDWIESKHQIFISHSSGGRKSKIKVLEDLVSDEEHSSDSWSSFFLTMFSHEWREKQITPLMSIFIRALILFMRAPSSSHNYFWKIRVQIPSLGVKHHMNFGEIQSVCSGLLKHSTWQFIDVLLIQGEKRSTVQ